MSSRRFVPVSDFERSAFHRKGSLGALDPTGAAQFASALQLAASGTSMPASGPSIVTSAPAPMPEYVRNSKKLIFTAYPGDQLATGPASPGIIPQWDTNAAGEMVSRSTGPRIRGVRGFDKSGYSFSVLEFPDGGDFIFALTAADTYPADVYPYWLRHGPRASAAGVPSVVSSYERAVFGRRGSLGFDLLVSPDVVPTAQQNQDFASALQFAASSDLVQAVGPSVLTPAAPATESTHTPIEGFYPHSDARRGITEGMVQFDAHPGDVLAVPQPALLTVRTSMGPETYATLPRMVRSRTYWVKAGNGENIAFEDVRFPDGGAFQFWFVDTDNPDDIFPFWVHRS